jgi:hypothetical protein
MDMVTAFSDLNWLAIVAAAVSAFVVGGIWYGPVFGKAWMAEFGFVEKDLAERNQAKIFGGTLLLNLLMAFNLAMFLGPKVDITAGVGAGFFTGFGFIAAFLGVFYLFEGKSLKLFWINSGFAVVSFVVMGLVLGAMN